MRELGQFLYGSYERAIQHELTQLGRRRHPTLRQLGFLPRVLTRHERRTALSLVGLALVSSLLITWRWYGRHTVVVPTVGGEYAEAIIGTSRTGNPLLAATDADRDLAYLTSRGLFRHDDSAKVVPDLAASWTTSPDQKSYRVTLRPNLHWSDGTPLTATDVEFTYQSVRDRNIGSPLAASFESVTAKREDDLTTVFTLPEPYAPFLSALTLGLIPAHIWQGVPLTDWRNANANLEPVGAGPYQVKLATNDRQGELKSLTLEPNSFFHEPVPFLTKVVLKFYPDSANALAALREGSVDGLGGVSPESAASMSELRFIQYSLNLPQYTALFYNLRLEGVLSSNLVRQALSYAINRPQLIEQAMGGRALPATTPFTSGELRLRAGGQGTSYDPKRVSDLLQQAGYSRADKNSPYLDKDKKELSITITAANSTEHTAVAHAIKDQLTNLGITVQLNLVPHERLQMDALPQRNYEVLLARELTGFDPDPYPFWHSSQTEALNLSGFKHHDADTLLQEARRQADWGQRIDRYVKFQNILNEEHPATFLYTTGYTYAVSRALTAKAPTIIAEPAERFRNLNLWYRATERQFRW